MAGLNQILSRSPRIGAGTVIRPMRDLSAQTRNVIHLPRIPTGIFPVDYALGGGIPCNDMVQFHGIFQSGKSLCAYLVARSLSRVCMRCLRPLALCRCPEPGFRSSCPTCGKPEGECKHKADMVESCARCGKNRIECECGSRLVQKTFLCHLEGNPPDDSYFRALGYDAPDNLLIGVPEYGEQACEMIEAAVRSDDCGLIVIDSLAAIMPRAEMECAYEDLQVAAQARLISKLFRRMSALLVKELRRGHLIGMIFINQVRANIGGGKWDPTEKTPGGWASKHGFRLSARLSQLSVDAEKGEKEKTDGMRNVSRFSMSLLGSESKQQLLILTPKAEYKIVMRPEWQGFASGTVLDSGSVVAVARELNLIEKTPYGYEFKPTRYKFRTLAEIDDVFRTFRYVNPDTGEVIVGADDVMRFLTAKRAREIEVERIQRSFSRVISVHNPAESKQAVKEVK